MDNGAQIPKTVRRSPLEKRIVFKLQVKRVFSISPLCVEAAQGALTQRVDEQAAIDNGPLCGALERGAAAMVSNGRVVRWARGGGVRGGICCGCVHPSRSPGVGSGRFFARVALADADSDEFCARDRLCE